MMALMAMINILVLLLVHLHSGLTAPTCEVRRTSRGWYYKIVGEVRPPCDRYDWTNGTGHVLVNHKQSDKAIWLCDDRNLHLAVCVKDIHRNRDCPRHEVPLVVKCHVNCTADSEIVLSTILLVHLSSGRRPTCEVTHDSKGWHYKISGNDTAPCTRYQWTNGTEVVLATHRPRDKSVTDKVIQLWNEKYRYLAVCVEDMQRNRECPSQNFSGVVTCPVSGTTAQGLKSFLPPPTIYCTEMYEASQSTGRRLAFVIPVLVLFLLCCF
ncbi:uncharacterized protein LOC133409696 isoform X2 [Phycodurus eques]|uniref:uncharacterized protein LOC133409696 isoform X2 n=1 Tax=Phycodurus eques TaxID=693459 RepID=UPI002ACD76BF|nr:uncharacterized protein LOC133409696 isoform X2 [Phycodurus eques]